jgi:dihydrodipicolinate synthase/N-acetylneuraminate lyase
VTRKNPVVEHRVDQIDPITMIRPGRHIEGCSAVLLPYDERGEIDWPGFRRLLELTVAADLTPAVNMDTGYVNLLTPDERARVLAFTSALGLERWIAGVFIDSRTGDALALDEYKRGVEQVTSAGAIPIIFPSHGLTSLPDDEVVSAHVTLGSVCDRFLAFELGEMFAPFGRIYSLDAVAGLMDIKSCIGAKHSSLRRELEWQRLGLRDRVRPDFRIYTGNDLAIDMVMYGSDYLLGLSAFAPDLFARRDRMWAHGDVAFYELHDALQYLGAFAFRDPVPAYKHTAAQFLALRGWIDCDEPHPDALYRPDGDTDVLKTLLGRLEGLDS